MTVFVVIGALGFGLLIAALLLGDVLEIDALDLDGGGLVSGPVLGAFLAAFGLGGALTASTGAGPGIASAAGVLSGAVLGWAAWRVTGALISLTDDEPLRTADIVGATARVVTSIPADGLGEVTVRSAGQLLKLHARADRPVATGAAVLIVDVESASSVFVVPDALFGAPGFGQTGT